VRNVRRQVIVDYKMSRVHLMQNDKESAWQKIKDALQLLAQMHPEEKEENAQYLENIIIEEEKKLENEIHASGDALFWI